MIRIRHPEGTATFELAPDSSLASLQGFIQQQSGIDPSEQELKTGYPPKTVSLLGQPADLLLSSPPLNLKRGEQIVVARRTAATTAPSAPRTVRGPTASSLLPKFDPSGTAIPKPSATGLARPGSSIADLSSLSSSSASSAAANQPTTKMQSAASVKDGEVSVQVPGDEGHLTLKVVPDDNSCLFNSVGFLFEQRLGSDVCQRLRKVVADAIRNDPEEYPDVILGQPRDSYINKILSPQTWGGAIELSILSSHFKVEIDSIDVATGVVHHFGEDKGYENRGIVVYSGIHYDVLALLPTPDSPVEFGTTLFPSVSSLAPVALDVVLGSESDPILAAARQLCDELKRRRYYTDTATFSLKCKVCGQGMHGEKEALQHAKRTGHSDFGEV